MEQFEGTRPAGEPSTRAKYVGLERWAVALMAAATVAAIVAPVAARAHPWLSAAGVLGSFASTPWAARALPAALDGVFARRRLRSLLWVALAALGVLQMGRLSAFMADASREWGSTVPDPSAIHHQCLSAYVYAADLGRQGVSNIYAAGWYPLFDPPGPTCRRVTSPVAGLGPWIADPYQYPPPFLLLPRAALALTNSFDTIRAWWFVLRALTILGAGILLARWIGGREGLVVGLLVPAVLASLPTMFDLQFGQFHAMAVLLACGAMVAFDSRRTALGGALLAAAILSKLFPAVLLLVLAARREWRALAMTAASGAALALLGLLVLGRAPYAAFARYELPRLLSGAAFHFTHEGSNAVFLTSWNVSIAAVGEKLRLLGATGIALALADGLAWAYTAALVPLALLASRRTLARRERVLVWIALLDLAAMRAPVAPGFYVLAPALWVLALLGAGARGHRGAVPALAIGWVIVMGFPPLPDRVELVAGLVCQAVAIGVQLAVVLRPRGGLAEPLPHPPGTATLVTRTSAP